MVSALSDCAQRQPANQQMTAALTCARPSDSVNPMPAGKKSPPSPLVRCSRSLRERAHKQQESQWLKAASSLRTKNKSIELCRHSDELLRRSHELCDKLRAIHNAC